MPVTLPIEVYEALEKGLGKEDAKRVVKSLEIAISDTTDYKWKTTKDELLDAIRKEFITKELFEERLNTLEERLNTLRAELVGKTNVDKAEVKAELEKQILRLDRKFTIMFLVLLFTIIFLNQNALEFLAKLLGLIK